MTEFAVILTDQERQDAIDGLRNEIAKSIEGGVVPDSWTARYELLACKLSTLVPLGQGEPAQGTRAYLGLPVETDERTPQDVVVVARPRETELEDALQEAMKWVPTINTLHGRVSRLLPREDEQGS